MFTEQHFSRTSRVATWAPSLAYVPYRTTASTPLSINRDVTWAPMCTIMRWRTESNHGGEMVIWNSDEVGTRQT
ncbi:hypothetical protein Tco_0437702, partial [Tanacetum coccineum]